MKNRLAERRKELHLTQLEVANAVHLRESLYQRYEYGTVNPTVGVALKIAKVLHTTVEELFPLETEA